MKIVSLVPSLTEALFDFGLTSEDVVGRTKFCIHPAQEVKNVQVIGGTKNLHLEKIKALNPDLILASKEENDQFQVEELMRDFKVWVTDIATLEDNRSFLTHLGKLMNKRETAENYNRKIDGVFSGFNVDQPKKVAYLIWKNPYMTVGSDTFIHDIIEKLGFENMFGCRTRYPEISVGEMSGADYIFLSSEPFPFNEKHAGELQDVLPTAKIIPVDGEAFSWYGTHLAKCSAYFKALISEDIE
ncbi:ABC transporter substrate-binding protein [Kaistella palustris]|uniref:ABC transporter substrate-binding protein n=1 Tax=Kaistella palustris TaxID=493376 RepID=UPI00042497A1|nr:helical backbone metal receptor [Kaistella palustris]